MGGELIFYCNKSRIGLQDIEIEKKNEGVANRSVNFQWRRIDYSASNLQPSVTD